MYALNFRNHAYTWHISMCLLISQRMENLVWTELECKTEFQPQLVTAVDKDKGGIMKKSLGKKNPTVG